MTKRWILGTGSGVRVWELIRSPWGYSTHCFSQRNSIQNASLSKNIFQNLRVLIQKRSILSSSREYIILLLLTRKRVQRRRERGIGASSGHFEHAIVSIPFVGRNLAHSKTSFKQNVSCFDMRETYFLFFGFGGGVSESVRFTIRMSFSRFSSHSGFTWAVFLLSGYAFVSMSSKYSIVSGKVFRNNVLSQARAKRRSQEYIPYSPNIAFAWRSGIHSRHSRK